MNLSFDDRGVLVTGAGHGIGQAIAREFADRGARVWACGIDEAGLDETRAVLGRRGHVRTLDVTDSSAVRRVVAEAAAETGTLDVLVNNAGGVCGQRGRPVDEVPDDDWQAIVDVNLTGTFHCSRAAAPLMKRAGRGRIINISSGAGLGVSLTGIQAYASAKAGQIGFTRQLAHELGPWGVTVNSIAPGFIRSNPTTERQWQDYGEEGQRRLIETIALRRLGTPEDIAWSVLFLASDYAGWLTGQVIEVNGGR